MVSQGATFALGMAATMVLARLLTPQDFGMVAMVAAVTGFIAMFKDMGLSMATIQKDTVTHHQISTLLWVNVAISIVIGIVIAACAVPISWFYDEPRLINITLVSAAAMPLSGLIIQHQALLKRQMRFGALAGIETTAVTIGVTTAVVMAYGDAGYWALVLMPIVAAVVRVTATWVVCGWRPGRPVRHSGVRAMLRFGGHLTGFDFVNYFARNLDNVLIGRAWGSDALGQYNKAYTLLLMPIRQINGPIAAVAIPALSRLQDDPDRFRSYYLKGVSVVAFLTMPLATFLFVAADDVIALLLGPQWTEAVVIFRYLAISAVVQPICNAAGWLYVSLGRGVRMLKWGGFSSAVLVASFGIGLPFGASGVALSYALAVLALTVPCLMYGTHQTPVGLRGLFTTVAAPMVGSLLAAGGAWSALGWLPDDWGAAARLTIGVVVHAAIYLAMIIVMARGLISMCAQWFRIGRR